MTILLAVPSKAHAACTDPVGVAGEVVYNTTYGTMAFCDNTNWISMAGGVAAGGGGGLSNGDKGDITVGGSGASLTVDDGAITYLKLQDVSASGKILGRHGSGAGTVQEITIGTGFAMSSGTLNVDFSGVGVADGDKGDLTVSGTGTVWTIDDDVLDFVDLSDAMALDASTSITADGAEVLTIINTGTADSFVVLDEASDTSPFVITADGSVAVGAASADASALMDLTSTTQGFLPPRMDTSERDAISSPAEGLVVYDTDLDSLYIYANGAWTAVGSTNNVVAFRGTTSSTVVGTSWTDIVFTAESYDLGGNNFAGSKFTAPEAGVYSFSATLEPGSAVNMGIVIQTDAASASGTQVCYANNNSSTAGIGCTGQISLTAGQVVEVIGALFTGSTTLNGTRNTFTGFKINGGGSGGGGSTPGGATGAVQFNNAGGLGGDEATFFWDNTNKRLGIGTATPAATSLLDLTSTTKGFLPPRMTTAQRTAISSPATGLVVYDTDLNSLYVKAASGWTAVGAGGTAVAFYVYRTSNATSNTGANVVYDTEAIDSANAHNSGTGVFTAPQAGTYQFNWGAIGNVTSDVYRYALYKNGTAAAAPQLRIDTMATGSTDYSEGTQTAYLVLAQGDTVSVRFNSDAATASYSDASGYMYFGGHLLNAGSGGGGSTTPSGTAGYVQISGGSTLDSDSTANGQFFWDKTNHRLGVGTATPAVPIDIKGSNVAYGGQLRLQASDYAQLSLHSDAGGALSATARGRILVGAAATGNGLTLVAENGSNTDSNSIFLVPGATSGVVINATGTGINASAKLQVDSTTQGFLPPRMTTAQRDAIASPAEGLVVYNTDTKSLDMRVATSWLSFGGNQPGSSMVSGWPDAIVCTLTAPSIDTWVLYRVARDNTTSKHWYRFPHDTLQGNVVFTNAGAFDSYSGSGITASNCNKSVAQLYADGQAFNFVGGSGSSGTVAIHVQRTSSNQTVTANTLTKIQLNTEILDSNNNFDNATNYRFTPTVAGKYIVTGKVSCQGSTECTATIYKNGSAYATGYDDAATGYGNATATAVIDMNGSSDYIELWGMNTGGTLIRMNETYMNAASLGGGSGGGGGSASAAGSTGGVQFNGGSSAFAADETKFFWDNTTKSLAIGAGSVASTALLDLTSTTKGFLPPRMTTAQRDAISSPATGLNIYNTTTNALEIWNGTTWISLSSGATPVTRPYLRLTYSGGIGRNNIIPFSVNASGGGATWSSNRFTASVAGLYLISLNARADEVYYASASILKNGSAILSNFAATAQAGKSGTASGSTVVSLAASDYIEFYWTHDNTPGTLDEALASIVFLGDTNGGSGGGGGSSQWSDITGGLSYASGGAVLGGGTLNTSAILQADSTTKGFLPPRMTTTQRDAISSPATGLTIYNTTTNALEVYNGATWLNSANAEVSFRATGSTTSLANGTFTDVVNPTQSFDNGGDNYNTTTGKFTAPTAGTYSFSGTVSSGIASGRLGVLIQIMDAATNGTRVCYNLIHTGGANPAASCTGVVSLTAGQSVEMTAYQETGSAQALGGAENVLFSGFKIGGSSGGGGGSTTLAALTDVDVVPAPTEGQSLVYNDTSDKWEPRTTTNTYIDYIDAADLSGAGYSTAVNGTLTINNNDACAYVTTPMTGDFTAHLTTQTFAGADYWFGAFASNEVGTFNSANQSGNLQGMTNSYWIGAASGTYMTNKGSTNVASHYMVSNTSYQIVRSGGVISLKTNGATTYSWAATYSSPMHVAICHSNNNSGQQLISAYTIDGANGGGGGGGSTTLADLTDVTIGTPTNGQALVYDTTTSKWIPTTLASGTMQQISQATGTTIGNLTGSGGLAAGFNGILSSNNASSSASTASVAAGYIGKNFTSVPQTIGQVTIYPTSESLYVGGSATSMIVNLRGKNGGAPSGAADGTLLGTSGSMSEPSYPITVNSGNTTTAWDYVWVEIVPNVSEAVLTAEVIFYKAVVAGGAPGDDSLDFDKFIDTMALDASTSITADGSEFLSVVNTGTGDSFVVMDQASDTTPFVIDAAGNVAIGAATVTAGMALDVVGEITANGVVFKSVTGLAAPGAGNSYQRQMMIVRDEKADGTAGGSSVVGIQTRTLNTVQYNSITGASLAANVVTLPAGTYHIQASAPTTSSYYNQIRLYNVTTSAAIVTGTSAVTSNAANVSDRSELDAIITLAAPTDIRLEHAISNAATTVGLGTASTTAFGPEVYATMTIEKLP